VKLEYKHKTKKRMLFPYNLMIEQGTEIEEHDKDNIKRLKDIGFTPVKESKEKEGEK
jgi:hypothetical protein